MTCRRYPGLNMIIADLLLHSPGFAFMAAVRNQLRNCLEPLPSLTCCRKTDASRAGTDTRSLPA